MDRLRPRLRIVLLTLLALCLPACSTFQLLDGDFQPKGRSMAVLPGLADDTNLLAARLLTEHLQKHSRYDVLSQKRIGQRIPDYPVHVKGPYRSAYLELDVDYGETDVKKLAEIQKRLGVDYLYVLWTPAAIKYQGAIMIGGNHPFLQVVAQCFEYPGGREIGHGHYKPRHDPEAALLRRDLEVVAREFAEKTKMRK